VFLRLGLRIRRIPPSRRLNGRSRTEEIIISRPLDVVLDAEAKTSLERTMDRNTSLPGVSGTHMLTRGDYGPPGSRRLTSLTDGSTLVEKYWKMCGTRTQPILLRRLELHQRKSPSDGVRSRTFRSNGSRLRPHSRTVDVFISAASQPLPGLSGANRGFPLFASVSLTENMHR
jgi:hypothetical protein